MPLLSPAGYPDSNNCDAKEAARVHPQPIVLSVRTIGAVSTSTHWLSKANTFSASSLAKRHLDPPFSSTAQPCALAIFTAASFILCTSEFCRSPPSRSCASIRFGVAIVARGSRCSLIASIADGSTMISPLAAVNMGSSTTATMVPASPSCSGSIGSSLPVGGFFSKSAIALAASALGTSPTFTTIVSKSRKAQANCLVTNSVGNGKTS
mmetsp:Transcript_36604/g.84173  ORF Transcript_36604/g.84173 Transcript_36604/m.84173 type:complete len:209 (-) Transcript_36604:222-848(-)